MRKVKKAKRNSGETYETTTRKGVVTVPTKIYVGKLVVAYDRDVRFNGFCQKCS